MSKKILLNSAYGALANQHFRYYSLEMAEGITTSGQLAIRWIDKSINIYINKLLGILALEIWYRLFITKDLNPNEKLTI